MSNEITISGEIQIRLDQLTLIHYKMQQLEQNKPRPQNHYQIEEKLTIEYDTCRDALIEVLIAQNLPLIIEKICPTATVKPS